MYNASRLQWITDRNGNPLILCPACPEQHFARYVEGQDHVTIECEHSGGVFWLNMLEVDFVVKKEDEHA